MSLNERIIETIQQNDAAGMVNLLDQGLSIDAVVEGRTLLEHAVEHKLHEILDVLLGRGADVNRTPNSAEPPLIQAVRKSHMAVAERLISNGASISTRDARGWSPLHYVACRTEGYEITCLLLEKGADPNAENEVGETPLHLAASSEIAEALLEAGADPHKRSEETGHSEARTPMQATLDCYQYDAAAVIAVSASDIDEGSCMANLEEIENPYYAEVSDWLVPIFFSYRRYAIEALSKRYPAMFFCGGDGTSIACVDRATGLPWRDQGDFYPQVCEIALAGHNAGVRDFIRRNGAPWNSRANWTEQLGDPERFFRAMSEREAPVELVPDDSAVFSPNGAFAVQASRDGSLELEVTSSKIWPVGHPLHFGEYECIASGRHHSEWSRVLEQFLGETHCAPKLGQDWSHERRSCYIGLPLYRDAEQVDLLWGPEGSYLAFIRFTEPKGPLRSHLKEKKFLYAALDLLTVQWLPPLGPDSGLFGPRDAESRSQTYAR